MLYKFPNSEGSKSMNCDVMVNTLTDHMTRMWASKYVINLCLSSELHFFVRLLFLAIFKQFSVIFPQELTSQAMRRFDFLFTGLTNHKNSNKSDQLTEY